MHLCLSFPNANIVVALLVACAILWVSYSFCKSSYFRPANFTTLFPPRQARRRSSASTPTNSSKGREALTFLARLAQVTYCASSVTHTGVTVPVGDVQGVNVQQDGAIGVVVVNRRGRENSCTICDVVDTWSNNSVWLFRPRDQTSIKADWIVAFRGSMVLGDIFANLRLIFAVATGDHTWLQSFFDEHFQELKEIIRADLPSLRGKENSKHASILLVGHSLGGVLTEAMSLYLHHEDYTDVSAVAFDTPGLPQCFRELFGSSAERASRRLTLVYGENNFVDNLTAAPREAISFRVRELSRQSIPSFASFIPALQSAPKFFRFLVSETYRKHNLENIADLLEKGEFERDSQTANRQLVGQAIRFLHKTGTAFLNMVRCVVGNLFTGVISAVQAKLFRLALLSLLLVPILVEHDEEIFNMLAHSALIGLTAGVTVVACFSTYGIY